MRTTLRPKNYVLSQGDIERAELCPASHVFVGPKLPPHPAAWYGIFLHRYLQFAKERGRDAALAYIRQKKKQLIGVCERINIEEVPDGLYEAGFVLDTEARTAEIAPHDTAEVDTHIYARSDLVFFDQKRGGIPHVVDYKSGDRAYDPRESVQLLTIACGVASAYQTQQVQVSVVNVRKTGELDWGNTYQPTEVDLQAHWRRMRRVHLDVLETRAELRDEGVQPAFYPGDHCRGCRAEVACLQAKVDGKRKAENAERLRRALEAPQ